MDTTQDVRLPLLQSGANGGASRGITLRFDGLLASDELEAQFRRFHLRADAIQARGAVIITITGFSLFGWNDYAFFGTEWPFFPLCAVRATVVAASAWMLWRLGRPCSPRQFDRAVFAWDMFVASAMLWITSTRPLEYAGHAIVNLVAVLATYGVIPLSLSRQAASALLLSAGAIALALWFRPLSDRSFALAMVGAFASANVVGALVSRQMLGRTRQQFVEGLQRTNEAQQAAAYLFPGRSGRRIAPICAFCQRVRSDSGRWESVESLFRDRTHAELSRSVCPDCERSVVARSAPDPIR